ncbi:MAG: ribose-5-phosphate isomerase RpiA [Gemmatimonadota bacterium]
MSQRLKELAARRAVEYVTDGMVVGLGSGSTAELAIRALGERARNGLRLTCVPTSESSDRLGREVGLTIASLEQHAVVDLTIDGADEVDGNLDLIKGLGGALLREKVVASCTTCEVIIVDASKVVKRLGTRGPLPVEIVPFGLPAVARRLAALASRVELRRDAAGQPFVTDNGNHILHCTFEDGIVDAAALERRIDEIPGVLESGLFVGLTHRVVVACEDGTCQILERG